MRSMILNKTTLLASLSALVLALPAQAYTADDEEQKTDEGAEPEERWLAVSGADVYSGTGTVLRAC